MHALTTCLRHPDITQMGRNGGRVSVPAINLDAWLVIHAIQSETSEQRFLILAIISDSFHNNE